MTPNKALQTTAASLGFEIISWRAHGFWSFGGGV